MDTKVLEQIREMFISRVQKIGEPVGGNLFEVRDAIRHNVALFDDFVAHGNEVLETIFKDLDINPTESERKEIGVFLIDDIRKYLNYQVFDR